MKYLVIVFLVLSIPLKAQLYIQDSFPQKYKVISIENGKRKRIKDINNHIKTIRHKENYSNKEKRNMIVTYRKHIKKLKHSLSSKCNYVLLLKNCETGGYFDVVVPQYNDNERKKMKVNNVYEIQLFKIFENDMVARIGYVWQINMDDGIMEFTGTSHTYNIFTYITSPRLANN